MECDEAGDERFRVRRAAGHVHIHGQKLVDARDDAIALLEGATAVGAGAHGQYVFGLGHLVVEAYDEGDHLFGDRTRNDDQIGGAG